MSTWPLANIQQLLAPTLAHLGYSIHDLQQSGRGGRTLRIVIDKQSGFVSIDDCARVSQIASPLLDQADLIHDPYTLEISSPGAERELRNRADYERFLGQTVNVRYRAGDAEVVLEGRLERVDDEGVTVLGHRDQPTSFDWGVVVHARLVARL